MNTEGSQPEVTSPFASSMKRLRAHSRPGALSVTASFLLHLAIVAATLGAARLQSRHEENAPKYITYKVRLFSPPPQVKGEPTIVAQPPKPIVIEKPAAVTPPAKAPDKRPDVKAAATPTKAPEKAKPKEPVAGQNPKPGSEGGMGIDVLQEGAEFPYPEYLQNIILQLHRYFRWEGTGNLEVEIGFNILKDGRVNGIQIVKSSPNLNFNIAVNEAVERAGRARAFGPLPAGFSKDHLPVRFTFLPPNR